MRQLKDLGLIIAYELHGFRKYLRCDTPLDLSSEYSYYYSV